MSVACLATSLLLLAACTSVTALQSLSEHGGVYICQDAHTSKGRSCGESRLSLLASTDLDFRSFAKKVCHYLNNNATMISLEHIDTGGLRDLVNIQSYAFFQYVLLAYALQKELPRSYKTLYSSSHGTLFGSKAGRKGATNNSNATRKAGKIFSEDANYLDDMWLEMGVEKGFSINVTSIIHQSMSATRVATGRERYVYGFDWFNGLPVEWFNNRMKGEFSNKGEVPRVRDGVKLVVGLFNDTLPKFLAKKVVGKKKIAFVNMDNDLYEGCRDVLLQLSHSGKMRYGSILHFHDLLWRRNESSACFGQEELLGVYDAMRINPQLKLELLPYRNRYFQNTLFRYLSRHQGPRRTARHGSTVNLSIPVSTHGDAVSERNVMEYVKKNLFVKYLSDKGETLVRYENDGVP